MTKRTPTVRGARIAMLAAVVALLVGALPVRGASSIDIEARALVGGRYEVSGWLAVAVTLANEGEPTEGYVVAETQVGTSRRFVEMPAGARKVVMLYVQPEAFQRQLTIRYDYPDARVETTVDVNVLQQTNDQVAIIGDGTGSIRTQMLAADDIDAPEPIVLAPADIPERPEPLGGLSAIVWAADSAGLSEPQRRAIERWIGEGGQLVVVAGGDWQARTAAFADLLPLENLDGVDRVALDELAAWTGQAESPIATATVATGDVREAARALVTAESGEVLASMRSIGAGRVVLIGPDMATDDFRTWEGSPLLWARTLPSNAVFEQFMGGGMPIRQELESSMTGALGTIPALDVPPAELLLAVIVAYILLIGPISYVVLRRVDRRELAWVTAPLLVVLFSACSYGIGRTMKGSDVVLNQIAIIRATGEGSVATVDTFGGIVSPDRNTYDLSVDADALLGRLARQDGLTTAPVDLEQGQPARLRGLTVPVFGFEAVRATGIVEHTSALSVTWSSRDGDLVGTVTNTSDAALTDVAFISNAGGKRIGRIEPGASVDFTLPGPNFNGSAASDQVYGFGGFDEGDEEQRVINLRRQVINALVGSFSMGPVSVDGGRRGPFVIGWREDAGPMPLTIDGMQARAYTSAVEVLSVRPAVSSGPVTFAAHQMGVHVIATDGDANPSGPGMMTLGEGSATYAISLPLDATGLVATSVEIVVGPDPSFVLSDPEGGFGGFWPQGFTLEVQDPGTGEWRTLGDLSQQSRFEIDDPATALSATGQIVVRITGVAVNPNFGQSSVFPSAEVSGVIDE